jgi:magnesium transporter
MAASTALASAVSVAVLGASAIATLVALFLPWLLNRLGMDPACGAGPLSTVVQDLLTITIYFAAVSILVN